MIGYFNFGKNYICGNVNYLRQDVKPLLDNISKKLPNENVYVYYGAISTYSYYSMIKDLPNAYFATYPNDENLSEKFLINDLKLLSMGTYYLLLVKGTGTYEKDMANLESWLKENYEIISVCKLKSAALFKVVIH